MNRKQTISICRVQANGLSALVKNTKLDRPFSTNNAPDYAFKNMYNNDDMDENWFLSMNVND